MNPLNPKNENDMLLTLPEPVFPSKRDKWVIHSQDFANPLVQFKLPTSNQLSYLGPPTRNSSFTVSLAIHQRTLRLIQTQLGKRWNSHWIAKTGAQKDLIAYAYSDATAPSPFGAGSQYTAFSLDYPAVPPLIKDMKVKVGQDSKEVNDFLQREGSQLRLKEFNKAPGNYGVAIMANMKLKWKALTTPTTIKNRYAGFTVSPPNFDITELDPDLTEDYLIRLYTTDPNISIYIRMVGLVHYSSADPYHLVKSIRNKRRQRYFYDSVKSRFSSVSIPNVSTKFMENMSQFKGLCIPIISDTAKYRNYVSDPILAGGRIANSFCIADAICDTQVNMNGKGLGEKTTSASSTRQLKPKYIIEDGSGAWMESFTQKKFIVDKPFILWVESMTQANPLFAGFFSTDSWEVQQN
jgi:hypothetical protein